MLHDDAVLVFTLEILFEVNDIGTVLASSLQSNLAINLRLFVFVIATNLNNLHGESLFGGLVSGEHDQT